MEKAQKLGFTLAEILIVLTIIGVMAVMTIPSLIQNSNSQQKITMFKKGINAITNAYATEFATKTFPKDVSSGANKMLLDGLNNQLNIKYYLKTTNSHKGPYTKFFSYDDFIQHWNWYDMMVTEDGISYYTTCWNGNFKCNTKLTVNSKINSTLAGQATCLIVDIDINGEAEPNEVCKDNADLNALDKCDRISMFVTKDGITAGNPDCTIAGRIMSDNTTYDESKCTEPAQNP